MYCIYKISIEGECYIGHTKNFNKRIKDHNYRKNDSKYIHLPLYKKMNECEDFNMEIIEMIECDKKTIFIKEQFYIDKYKPSLNKWNAIVNKQVLKERNKIRMRNLSPEKQEEYKIKHKERYNNLTREQKDERNRKRREQRKLLKLK